MLLKSVYYKFEGDKATDAWYQLSLFYTVKYANFNININ